MYAFVEIVASGRGNDPEPDYNDLINILAPSTKQQLRGTDSGTSFKLWEGEINEEAWRDIVTSYKIDPELCSPVKSQYLNPKYPWLLQSSLEHDGWFGWKGWDEAVISFYVDDSEWEEIYSKLNDEMTYG